ncbi:MULTISPECIES: 50S ribosomal protein L1 [Candidatus Ichthyocystis]|uniref:50S ribosomal protein L1 n=1 Tax=Candidatus Ichthyocystis TaxID=2929841 RepID=UPI000B150409|nr:MULTISPECIES: 50S ribosomal protein L1 [Ichthyocystis]
MAKLSRRFSSCDALVDRHKLYQLDEALPLLKRLATARFDETVDIAVCLGVDPRKSDQVVRGCVVLPSGTGKVVRVAVFAQGEKADAARVAGADIVGFEDLSETIKAGTIDFDVLVASPDSMRLVGQLGQILGPRGLMPNPKVGTVAVDVAAAVKNVKSGQVQYRTDKTGIVHCAVGKASFPEGSLRENIVALMSALSRAKPASSKGTYFKKVFVSSTMGRSVRLDVASIPIV